MRAPVRSANVATFTPPVAKAGCSGIDLYGGSFSYINKEEFVAFMRSIAANAQGYAFQIALSSMCEKCSQHMELLQKKVQELNQYFGNSCQLAQGLVNDSLSAFNRKGLNDASLIGQFEGIGDLFELNAVKNPQEVYDKASAASPEATKKLSGNIVWQALLNNPVFKNDLELAQELMSITGSIIIDGQDSRLQVLPHGLIGLRQLVEGGEALVYRCNTTGEGGCLEVQTQAKTIKGLGQRIYEMFCGDGARVGVIDRFANNSGALTDQELSIINAMPSGLMAKIRTLSAKNSAAAKSFVASVSSYLGYFAAEGLIDQYLRESEALIAASGHSHTELMLAKLKEVNANFNTQRLLLADLYGSETDINLSYEQLLKNIETRSYTLN